MEDINDIESFISETINSEIFLLSAKAYESLLETLQQAQACPSPATIFSLYLDGAFVTTDISVCLDSRFDKIVKPR